MPTHEVLLADTPTRLRAALTLLEDLDTVGIDVERADWDRYWRSAALIQVGGADRVALIDPLALPELGGLASLLASRTCVLHAMENDLGPLASLDIVPPVLEDTSIAAAMLGLPLGLEVLLRDLLDVELAGDKAAMQRADWEARPLRPEMLAYAAADVADLPALWSVLHERLQAEGREQWYRQELEVIRQLPPVEQRRAWTRTKGLGRLDAAARARLRSLWDAREHLARTTNTAPSRIAADKLLVDLAVRPPASKGELGRRGLRRGAVRNWGASLMEALRLPPDTDGRSAHSRDHERVNRAPTDKDRALVDELRAIRAERAEELGIDPGVLCPSRTLLGAVLADPITPAGLRDALQLRPWQWEQLGARFTEALGLDGEGTPDSPEVRPPAARGSEHAHG
jgi:ribonuclease D